MAHFFVFNRRSARIPIFGGWDLQHFVFFFTIRLMIISVYVPLGVNSLLIKQFERATTTFSLFNLGKFISARWLFFLRVLMLAHYIFTLVRIKHIYQKPQISTYTNTVCFFPRSLKTQGALKSNCPLLSEYPFFFLNLASTALSNIVSSSSSHSKYYSFAHLLQHRTLPLHSWGRSVLGSKASPHSPRLR